MADSAADGAAAAKASASARCEVLVVGGAAGEVKGVRIMLPAPLLAGEATLPAAGISGSVGVPAGGCVPALRRGVVGWQ